VLHTGRGDRGNFRPTAWTIRRGTWTGPAIAASISSVSTTHARSVLLLLATAVIACDEGDARFATRFASDFAPARHTVSVLGVYKDGRMSSDGWQALAPRVAPALGAAYCEVGYETLASANRALADAIDEYTRADGPTDDLLAQLTPAAKGDLVLVVTFAGKLPQRMSDAGAPGRASAPSAMGGRGGGRVGGIRGAGRMRRSSTSEGTTDNNLLDISASLFSVTQKNSVALVAMQYSGKSLDDAIEKFAAKLAQSLPSVACVGWNWEAKIDPERIRQSIDP
jgi:hypothetical protein